MSNLPELLVCTRDELAACCDHIAGCSVFGFDTEFIGEQTFHPRLCLVQVATPERLYIIDPLEVENLTQFWEMVADPKRVAVVHAGREEMRMCRHHLGRPATNVFDLQIAAGLVGAGYPAGHGTLVQQILRVRLNKGETLTDWSRRPLTKHQIRYAYDDVRFLLPLYDKIRRRLTELGRLEWMAEELNTMQSRWLDDDPEREPWRKLRGLGGLDRRELAVVREVFAWRAERGAIVNKPARYLLRDDLIVELARRMPTTEAEVSVVRGVTRHDIPGLLAAVARGRNVPDADLPSAAERDNDPPQVAIVNGLLQSVLASFCADERLTPALVATTSDLKAIIRAQIDSEDTSAATALSTGWRAAHVLPVLMDVLQGRRGVRVGKVNSPAPLRLEPKTPDGERKS
jgi:ribonuclease D